MRVTVTILGAGGSYPPPGFTGPCILVESPRGSALLDAGSGCLSSLLEVAGPCSVSEAYITHGHIDHWSDLPLLAVARTAEHCPGELRVYAPWGHEDPGKLETLERVLPRSASVAVVPGPPSELAGLPAEAWSVEHSSPAYGVSIRLPGGQTLVSYTGDTRYWPGLAGRVEGSLLLAAEATLPSGLRDVAAREGHMTVEDFLLLARESRAERAVPVHLSPYSLRELLASERRGNIVVARRYRLEAVAPGGPGGIRLWETVEGASYS